MRKLHCTSRLLAAGLVEFRVDRSDTEPGPGREGEDDQDESDQEGYVVAAANVEAAVVGCVAFAACVAAAGFVADGDPGAADGFAVGAAADAQQVVDADALAEQPAPRRIGEHTPHGSSLHEEPVEYLVADSLQGS